MDKVPEDDPEFQGLLEEPAQYPDVLAKRPGVELKCELADDQVVTDEPEPNFAELAAAALENAGIDPHDRLQSAQATAVARPQEPALIEADNDEIVYEIILDLPDAGLIQPDPSHDDRAHAAPAAHIANDVHDLGAETVDLLTDEPRQYPTQSHRSVIGNKLYDRYSTRTTFLQLGEARAHRSVLDSSQYVRMTREERIHARTWSGTGQAVDDVVHTIDKELVTNLEDKLKVWAYVMTQYNLKPGFANSGRRRPLQQWMN
jgi:hypothetical protein